MNINSFETLKQLDIFKVHEAYEIHYCDFIITALFDPPKVLAITGDFKKCGHSTYKGREYTLTTFVNNDSVILEVHLNDEYLTGTIMEVELTLNGHMLHVELIDTDGREYYPWHYFDVEVKDIITRVKSAAGSRRLAGC
jgi:small nuclear ribonucleoprotein (snRNP)-like protein